MKPKEKPVKKRLKIFSNFRKNFDLLASRVRARDQICTSPEEPVLLNCVKREEHKTVYRQQERDLCHQIRTQSKNEHGDLQPDDVSKIGQYISDKRLSKTSKLFSGFSHGVSRSFSVANICDPQENNRDSCNIMHSNPSNYQAIRSADHEIENFKRRFLLPRLTEKDSMNESGYGPESSVDPEAERDSFNQGKGSSRMSSFSSREGPVGTMNFESLRQDSELTEGMLLDLVNQAREQVSSHSSPVPSYISDSECDSGAFSRTSSPENGAISKSMTIADKGPLISPPLVLSIVKESSNQSKQHTVDTNLVLSCLNEAGKSSKFSVDNVSSTTNRNYTMTNKRKVNVVAKTVNGISNRQKLRGQITRSEGVYQKQNKEFSVARMKTNAGEEPVTVTIGLTSQLSVSPESDTIQSYGGHNVSLPDISRIGGTSHSTVIQPSSVRIYNSTSSLVTTTMEDHLESSSNFSERILPREFNSSFYTISLISPEISYRETKDINNMMNPVQNTKTTLKNRKMISSQLKSSQVCHLNCGSKVTVNGKHHCSKIR